MLNLVLVGFMGTGKSIVARKAAEQLGLPFADTDCEIERVMNMPIKDIFQKYGEVRFRSEETAAIQRLLKQHEKKQGEQKQVEEGRVIATGGGVVLKEENMALLGENGIVVCLEASPEEIFRRIGHKKDRPLLAGADPMGEIQKLLEQRDPYYSVIPFHVLTDGKSVDEVVQEVIGVYRREKEKRGQA